MSLGITLHAFVNLSQGSSVLHIVAVLSKFPSINSSCLQSVYLDMSKSSHLGLDGFYHVGFFKNSSKIWSSCFIFKNADFLHFQTFVLYLDPLPGLHLPYCCTQIYIIDGLWTVIYVPK